MKPTRLPDISLLAIVAITFVGSAIWLLNTTFVSDDFFYRCAGTTYFEFWNAQNEEVDTFRQAFALMNNHLWLINGRLANLAHIFFQPLPRSIEAIVMALCIALMVFLSVRNARCSLSSQGIFAVAATLLIWIALPWYDYMQSVCFQMNYSASTVLLLTATTLYDRSETLSRPGFAALCALCLITGWWHEAFGIVLTAITGIYALSGRYSWRRSAPVVFNATGIIIGLATSTLKRFGMQEGSTDHSVLLLMGSRYLIQLWPLWLACAMFAIEYFRSPDGRRELLLRQGAFIVAAICNICIAMILTLVDRALWPAQILAVIVILGIAAKWIRKIPAAVNLVCCGVFAVAYIAWFYGIVKYQKITTAQQLLVEQQLAPRGPRSQNVCYVNLTPADSIPWYLLDIPAQTLHNYFNRTAIFAFYNRSRKPVCVVPTDCRNLPVDQWPLVEGSAALRGQWPQLYTADSTIRHLALTFGPADSNTSPFDRVAAKARGADSATFILPWWPVEAITDRGDTIYSIIHTDIPRSIRHRRLLRVDTIAATVP